MRIGVTGGLGLLGRAVVQQLGDRGHDPLIIDLASAARSGPADVELRTADIRDLEQISSALDGLDAVVHTASLIDLHLGRPSALYEVNVLGAQNVVQACRRNGVPRLVHMSSAEVVTSTKALRGITECDASYPDEHLTYYGVTKQGGEQTVLGSADAELGTCAMRTYGLFGPGDNTVLPLYLSTLPGKSIVQMGDLSARTDVIFAPNLAHCLVLAVEQLEPEGPWSGSAFHVTDHEAVNIQTFLGQLVSPLGYQVNENVTLPRTAAAAMASFFENRYRMVGIDRFARPPLTHHKLRLALDDYWLDSSLVRDRLGYEPPFSREESVRLTQEWLVADRGGDR